MEVLSQSFYKSAINIYQAYLVIIFLDFYDVVLAESKDIICLSLRNELWPGVDLMLFTWALQ